MNGRHTIFVGEVTRLISLRNWIQSPLILRGILLLTDGQKNSSQAATTAGTLNHVNSGFGNPNLLGVPICYIWLVVWNMNFIFPFSWE
jgi:hypothetical protein